jgi:D-alanyl-lipoteichoic acid acyltransferase DltB (MBOAT superfamily)
VGLFCKIVVADGLMAPIVERVYDSAAQPDFKAAWIGTLAFAWQIFGDFSGYSACAIGSAACLGFWLPRNFHFPYAAVGFSDFWRRWHISLSSWLRDYLYIPMGGNRGGAVRTHANLLATMLLGGLWHGAAWTFVLWGGLHGLLLAIERWLRARWGDAPCWRLPGAQMLLGALTFVSICYTWVLFRAHGLARSLAIAGGMSGQTMAPPTLYLPWFDIGMVAAFSLLALTGQWFARDRTLEQWVAFVPWWLRALGLAGMMLVIAGMPGADRAFIYFQF